MQWETAFIQTLKTEFAKRQAADSKYSLRRFAKDLGLSASGMSNLLNNRFELSLSRASSLLPNLNLTHQENEKLRLAMGLSIERKVAEISPIHSTILTDWVYFAVMHFFDLDVDEKSVPLIAQRLSVDLATIQQALDKLLAEGFLKKAEDGSIHKPEIHWHGGDGGAITKDIIRAHHRENLKVASRAIDLVPTEQRDFSSITFCGSPEQMNLAREEVRNLHQKVSAIMENSSPKTEIYRLSVALFPLTVERPS